MKKLFLVLFLLVFTAQISPSTRLHIADTVETAFGSVAATFAVKLAQQKYVQVDVVNNTDCDVEIEFEEETVPVDPISVIPAGTSETLNFWPHGYIYSSVGLRYMSGETCASGSVYMKGIYRE